MATETAIRKFHPFTNYDFSNFYFGSGDDVCEAIRSFNQWWDEAFPGGYHIYREPFTSAPGTHISIRSNQGKHLEGLLNFSSYNYLGMSNAPVVTAAAVAAINKYGLGASGGPNLSGMYDIHRELEASLAAFKKKEACTTFNSGYAANLGIISGIMRSGDTIFLDQYSHASIVDGAILSKAKTVFFRHNNAADLERKLAGTTGRKLVIVEGVYSMDGDFCNLPEIVEVSKKHGARIMIDEAHSAFVVGENGRGVVEHFGLEDAVDFHMGTFSKALGGLGGYACGDREFVLYLEAYARSRFFSCTLPPSVSAGVLAALNHIEANPEIRLQLWHNVEYLQKRLKEVGVDTGQSTSQVIPIMVYEDAKVFGIAKRLREEGIFLQPVNYPAVSKGKARLRLSVSASHTLAQLEYAAQTIANILQEAGIPCDK
ncbi:MAG: aminotransferase class I/II-fold pyridoxal phosphate-dependent enzyme [Saprospiraceae bacterium]|nr:aminotransferase class I/II-fold pyridoxal phosphate-dependent enzyme [Saprospiraceae bacterium]